MDVIIPSKRVEYAQVFMSFFKEEFAKIAETPDTDIEQIVSRDAFDRFLIRAELVEVVCEDGDVYYLGEVPEKGSTHWSAFVSRRNMVRTEMNAASQYGLHGEPPFRLDVGKGGQYVLRSMVSIARVSQQELLTGIQSLCNTKQKENSKMVAFLHANLKDLPPVLRGSIRAHDTMFKMTVNNALSGINQYLAMVEEDHRDAQLHLSDTRKRLG